MSYWLCARVARHNLGCSWSALEIVGWGTTRSQTSAYRDEFQYAVRCHFVGGHNHECLLVGPLKLLTVSSGSDARLRNTVRLHVAAPCPNSATRQSPVFLCASLFYG